MPSQMLDDELCWALDEGLSPKMGCPDKAGWGKGAIGPLLSGRFFHNAATPWVLLEQVILHQ